jgi:hypothetical protein
MKKLLLSILALVAVSAVQAQNVSMYIEVDPTTDLKNIPVTLYMTNDVQIIGLQATFALPAGLTKEKYNYDEDEEMYFLMTNRATKNHQRNSKNIFKASAPNDLFINCVSDNGSAIKENSGAIGTFWFDGRSLADGTYTVKMYDACAFPDANSRIDAAGKHTPEQSADYKPFECEFHFVIANGAVTSGIGNITVGGKANGIYNIAGQQMKGLQKGINIVDGNKIFVK